MTSTETQTLTEFLRERIAEDEAVAKSATPGPWSVNDEAYPEALLDRDGIEVVSGGRWGGEARIFNTDGDAFHMARHNPARVLTQVKAMWAIVESVNALTGGERTYEERLRRTEAEDAAYVIARDMLRHLAAIWADHPDYRPEWRV